MAVAPAEEQINRLKGGLCWPAGSGGRRPLLVSLLMVLLLGAACSRSRVEDRVVIHTVPAPQTVVVRETVIVERIVEVTPTPDLSRQPVTLHLNLGEDPPAIDPALAEGVALDVAANLFWGLTALDEQGNVQPALATAWSVSDDGLRWTFTLRDDVTWVNYRPASGVTAVGPVSADDVVYAVRRACDPRTAAAQARLNYVIAGCQALHTADLSGRSAEQIAALLQAVGVEALDEVTVQFTLVEPAGYLPALLALPLNRPLHQSTVEEHGLRWTEAGNIVSNGPYLLAGWFHGDHMTLERNLSWPGWADAVGNVERIELAMLPEASALDLYRAGRLDSVLAPPTGLAQVRSDETLRRDLSMTPVGCTEYLGFSNVVAPLDDALVRRALSAAIDRQALVETAARGGAIPANAFAPPGVFGSAAGDLTIAPWALPEAQGGWGYGRSLAQAQAWLAEAGYPGGQGLPVLTLLHNTAEGPAQVAQAIAAMWRSGLNVEVTVQSLPWREYWSLLSGDTPVEQLPHAWRMGFCGDLPDQHGWLHQQFNTDQGVDRLRWVESANAPLAADGRSFNELTAAAQRSSDPAERQALYREAERILGDASDAYAPLYYYASAHLTQPYVQRSFMALGGNRFETWVVDWQARQAAQEK